MKRKSVITLIIASIAAFSLYGCSGRSGGGNVIAVGSSALQPLAQYAAQELMSRDKDINITVQGGGSGMGLSQIIAGSVQVGNSDVFAEAKKVHDDNLIDNKVAVMGVGPVVNKDVKVDNLTTEQLIGIFTGKITNWKDVGGDNLPIVVINRAEGSGTRATFEEFGLRKNSSMKAQEQDNSGSVQKIVSQTPGAISYLAFSYFNDTLKPVKIDGIAPTEKNVMDNSWKIWSYEHMYTRKGMSSATKKYIDFVKSKKIQETLVPKLGYIPITKMKVERNYKGELINQ